MKFVSLLLTVLALAVGAYASDPIAQPAHNPFILPAVSEGGGGGCTPGTAIIDTDFADAGSTGNLSTYVDPILGAFTGTNASDGNLLWDATENWAESDSGSDGLHKYAWLTSELASDVFTSTSVLNTTTGGTSTRTGIFFGTIKPATTLGWEGYRIFTGDGNIQIEECSDDGTCTDLLTEAQTNANANRNLVVDRREGGEWYVSYDADELGTVTDTTYAITHVGIYIRNLGRVASIQAACQ